MSAGKYLLNLFNRSLYEVIVNTQKALKRVFSSIKCFFFSILFFKVDVDECEDLATRFEISSMPTFLFIKNGEKVDSFSGANRDKLEKTITQYTG